MLLGNDAVMIKNYMDSIKNQQLKIKTRETAL